MHSPEQLLEQAAQDGSFNEETWPGLLEDICKRIDTIVSDTFPRIPPQTPIKRNEPSSQESQVTDKENAPPASDRPPVPPFNSADAPYVLPLELAQLHQSIKDTLQKSFTDHPPYTLQRLSELILQPKKHYRFLGPYLRALDRVVNVSSNVNHYPLTTGPHSNLVNGGGPTPPNSGPTADDLGSDESLGGALLTPIPWLSKSTSGTPSPTTGRSRANTGGSLGEAQNFRLRNESAETIIGPDGKPGKAETVSVSVVPTQSDGDADRDGAMAAERQLRSEDAARGRDREGDVPMEEEEEEEEEEEGLRVRGPDVITAEDTGKVEGTRGGRLDFDKAAGKDKGVSGSAGSESAMAGEKTTGLEEGSEAKALGSEGSSSQAPHSREASGSSGRSWGRVLRDVDRDDADDGHEEKRIRLDLTGIDLEESVGPVEVKKPGSEKIVEE